MAEVIGLISGLMTVSNAGLRLFQTLHNFANTIRSAEEDIVLIAAEIRDTTGVIGLLKRSLEGLKEKNSMVIEKGMDILPGLTTQCEYVFVRIEELVSFLRPYHDPAAGNDGKGQLIRYCDQTYKRPKLLEKWKWQQQIPNVDRLRRYLEALKSNLALLLAIMDHEIAVERRDSVDLRRVLREEVNNAFRNATACSEDLDREVNFSSSSMPPTSMALVAPQHRVLRPQRAVKNLALEMVLWRNETESTKIQSTADYHGRSTSAASHQHSIDNKDTGINDQVNSPRDRRGIPQAEAPTKSNFRPRRSTVDLGGPRIMKEQYDFGERISVVRRPSQNSHDSQTKPYQSAISSKALLEAGIPFDEDDGIPHFSGRNLSDEEIQRLVKRTEQTEREEAAATKFVSEPLQDARAGSRKAPPTQAPKQTRARPSEGDEVCLSTRSALRAHKGRRSHMAPRADSPIRGQSDDYDSNAAVAGSLRASGTGSYYDNNNSNILSTSKSASASASASQAAAGSARNPYEADLDSIIDRLLEVRGSRPGKQVQLLEAEIRYLCTKAREIFMSQPILLELEAPLKVIGDIHGQYYDLLRFFEYGGFPPEANYVFLGNYVDHGEQSLEVICLIVAYKIKYPENFFLLRGNHECASVNRIHGFYDECKRRYNIRLWKTFIDMFNCMPIAAIIDEKIFCIHGGLSPDLNSMYQIRRIMRPTAVPDCGLLCDLLWSDPDKDITGWSENNQGVSFIFGPDVVSRFLTKHNMEFIVRGDSVVEDGYEFFSKRQLVTIWSAPNYRGKFDNAGAMMNIDASLLCSFQILKPEERKQRFGRR